MVVYDTYTVHSQLCLSAEGCSFSPVSSILDLLIATITVGHNLLFTNM